jgi:predicted aminopeptidase
VPYRGYFARPRAEREADALRREHLDVRVAGVAAYSTLGWFRDPVLESQLRLDDTELAAVLFHELAHQKVYVPGDATFNESFATTVEVEGLRRWLAATGNPAAFETWQHARTRQQEFVDLVLRCRARLAELYASGADDDAKRAGKQRLFAELRNDYAQLKTHWGGDNRYDGWVAQDLNNAHLAGIGLYHEHVPEFQRLLAAHGGDLPAFYRAARKLSRLPAAERNTRLAALTRSPAGAR